MALRAIPVSAALAIALLGALIALAAMPRAEADAATLTACVNNKTGAMKMVFGNKAKRKCPKGSKKVTWPNESGLSVFDANGKRVGRLLGVSQFGPYTLLQVLRSGGSYTYSSGGPLFPSVDPNTGFAAVTFKTADCSGKAYVASGGVQPPFIQDLLKKSFLGDYRLIFRTFQGSGLGTPVAHTGDGTVEYGPLVTTYTLNPNTGACELDEASFTGGLYGLKTVSIPNPVDFTGPLRIR